MYFWPVRKFLLSFYSNENLTQLDTSLSRALHRGTLLSVQKLKMNLTKWDIPLFECCVTDVFTNISVNDDVHSHLLAIVK